MNRREFLSLTAVVPLYGSMSSVKPLKSIKDSRPYRQLQTQGIPVCTVPRTVYCDATRGGNCPCTPDAFQVK